MDRKIMSLGRSSLVVSLPKHWVKLNELKRGDVVSLAVQRDRSLVIYPSAQKKKESEEIVLYVEPDEEQGLIVRKIIGCYLNGYSQFHVISKGIFSVPQRKAIRNVVRMLYMRIMEADSKSMRIQTLIDESKASIELAIRRMHLITYSMCQDMLNSLKNQDMMLAKSVFSLDDDVDHFSLFLLRLLRNAAQDPALANQLGVEPLDCMDFQALVHRVEHVADYSANIARHLIMLNGRQQKIPEELLSLMFAAGTEATNLYSGAVEAFFTKDIESSFKIIEQEKTIEKMDQEIASKTFMSPQKNALTVCAICSIRDCIKRIAEFAADIAEISVNRAYKRAT